MPKVKVTVVTQSGWMKETPTDPQGQVSFDLPWKGSYILEVGYIEAAPGERQTSAGPEKYDGINHVTTLHVMQADGVAAIPAGPVATPGK